MKIHCKIFSLLLIPILGSFLGCGEKSGEEGSKPEASFAYVTNGVDPFWDLCAAGVRIAEKEFGVSCEVLMPPKGVVDQKRMMETQLAKGVSGIAVSPVDAENQTPFLNEVSENTILITNDSDAPESKRLVFIGTNNYKAGRALGGLVKKALPEGGQVMLFVGRLEQLNARQRRQGVIDELLGRPVQTLELVKYDPVDATNLTSGDSKYSILDTRTDNFDKARAKSNAEDAIAKYQDLKCMVGLFAYNSPSCIDAIKEADKLGTIKICGFDEQDALLQAITDGHAYGTISQQPWEYGYESIKMLKNIWDGNQPATTYQEVSFLEVTKENIDEFWAKKKEMAELGKSN